MIKQLKGGKNVFMNKVFFSALFCLVLLASASSVLAYQRTSVEFHNTNSFFTEAGQQVSYTNADGWINLYKDTYRGSYADGSIFIANGTTPLMQIYFRQSPEAKFLFYGPYAKNLLQPVTIYDYRDGTTPFKSSGLLYVQSLPKRVLLLSSKPTGEKLSFTFSNAKIN